MTGSAIVLRADARTLPLPDDSVDLIVTSPPYFALRSYRDDGEHYDGQVGSEPTPQAFLEALWTVTAECWRVLKPSGSMFVNLGDKRSGSGGHNNAGIAKVRGDAGATRRNAPDRYTQTAFGRPKSKMLLPHRYAIGCEDGYADPEGLGWIVRQDLVWSKPNGLPESVRDRTRDAHEFWFHLTKQGDYFAAVDEIREPHTGGTHPAGPNAAVTGWESGAGERHRTGRSDPEKFDARGKLPGSVWSIPTEPLTVPEWLGVDHFAAFPTEWPRRLILGWSPSGICTACGDGRRPVVDKRLEQTSESSGATKVSDLGEYENDRGWNGAGYPLGSTVATITGYACACPDDSAPTRPAVVLDPFGGTGTVAMVARAHGRLGISVDLSADYCRLARWRIFDSGHAAKVQARTNLAAQGAML